MNRSFERIRGLKDLLVDAVDGGAHAIEKVHVATAKRTFDVLEAIPAIDAPTKVVHAIHDVSVRGVYGAVRIVTRAVGSVLDVALDSVEPRSGVPSDAESASSKPATSGTDEAG